METNVSVYTEPSKAPMAGFNTFTLVVLPFVSFISAVEARTVFYGSHKCTAIVPVQVKLERNVML